MNSVELVNGGMGIKNPMLQHSRFPAQSQQLGKFEYMRDESLWKCERWVLSWKMHLQILVFMEWIQKYKM